MTETKTHKHSNRLIKESSPYLLQHAHNPVDWYPWGDEAFEKAKRENKLVLISIGYAACHWCHVMEKESFENEAIAALMNEHYVCIKVDREERPDVDNIYMSAVQMITGSGGWPLNCFVLPDRRPIYGGTYFRSADWKNVLIGLNATHTTEPEKLLKAADEITQGINQMNILPKIESNESFVLEELTAAVDQWKKNFDEEWGGNNRAPKFPMPVGLSFFNEYEFYTDDSDISTHLQHTLNKMTFGGIYDQVGGGFSRYSVDEYWKVPHFEKMLYDNAQLISLYSKAYQQTKSPLYKKVVEQSLEFIAREMKSKENAYYSSYDADSEGEEGKFYVWTQEQLKAILDPSEHWVLPYYNVKAEGNWEGSNILWVTDHKAAVEGFNEEEETFLSELDRINKKVLKERNTRVFPGLDNKVLTEWNALLGIGFLDAYKALGDEKYLKSAKELASYFRAKVIQDDAKVFRNYTNGTANIDGVLNDYANLIQFFIQLYTYTLNEKDLIVVQALLNYTLEQFYSESSGMFFYTSTEAKDLISRTIETSDNVIPSSNAIMAHNLLDLSILLGVNDYRTMSLQMLQNVKPNVEQNLPYFSLWGSLWLRFTEEQYEVVVCGENAKAVLAQLQKEYLPHVIFAGTDVSNEKSDLFKGRWVEGKTLIYVCKNNACQLPVGEIEKALALIK